MSISTKTTIPILLMALLLSLAAYFIQQKLVYPAFSKIEIDYARDNIDRVVRRLHGEIDIIDFTVYDWSSWDDTYRFIEDGNDAFVESNLSADTFLNYGIQMALFLDSDNNLVWGGYFDYQAEDYDINLIDPYLASLRPTLARLSRDIDPSAPIDDRRITGVLNIDDTPLLFAMRPIHKSDGTGEPRGYVMFGQLLSEQRIDTLAEQIVLDFSVSMANGSADSDATGAYAIRALSEDQLSASKIMTINGVPELRVSTILNRDITRLGGDITVYGIVLFVMLSLLMSAILLVLFRVLVIRPILDLKNDIAEISGAMDYSLRAHIRNEDEIGALSQEFNAMLGVIESNNKEMKKLTETDPLTGLFNRLALDKKLAQAWHILTRTGDPLAVMLIDIDHFKAYNDHYGHLAGDQCLEQIARLLEGAAKRDSDMVARFGGEEFLIVLPGTDAEAALDIAHGLLESIDNAGIEHSESSTAPVITVSIGVSAVIPSQDFTSSDLIQTADKALYRAKELGRNRVEYESNNGRLSP